MHVYHMYGIHIQLLYIKHMNTVELLTGILAVVLLLLAASCLLNAIMATL
jgi:hypothetical protein